MIQQLSRLNLFNIMLTPKMPNNIIPVLQFVLILFVHKPEMFLSAFSEMFKFHLNYIQKNIMGVAFVLMCTMKGVAYPSDV